MITQEDILDYVIKLKGEKEKSIFYLLFFWCGESNKLINEMQITGLMKELMKWNWHRHMLIEFFFFFWIRFVYSFVFVVFFDEAKLMKRDLGYQTIIALWSCSGWVSRYGDFFYFLLFSPKRRNWRIKKKKNHLEDKNSCFDWKRRFFFFKMYLWENNSIMEE